MINGSDQASRATPNRADAQPCQGATGPRLTDANHLLSWSKPPPATLDNLADYKPAYQSLSDRERQQANDSQTVLNIIIRIDEDAPPPPDKPLCTLQLHINVDKDFGKKR